MIFGIQISNKIQIRFLGFFKYQIKFKYDFVKNFELWFGLQMETYLDLLQEISIDSKETLVVEIRSKVIE